MLRPLQQHPHFAACLRVGGRDVVETQHGVTLVRRFAGVSVGLVSRGSKPMLSAPAPQQTIRLFTSNCPMGAQLTRRGFRKLRQPVQVAEWDITPPMGALRAGLRKTWRHGLEQAEASGLRLTVARMPASGAHWLYQAEAAQARQRGYRSLPLWITRAWATLHPEDTALIEARHQGS